MIDFDRQLSRRKPQYQHTKRKPGDFRFGFDILKDASENASISAKDAVKFNNEYEARFWARKAATFALDYFRYQQIKGNYERANEKS